MTTTKDAEGFSAETLTPIAPPLWAYFRQLSGKEFFAAATVQSVEARTYFDNPELFAKDSYVSGHTTGPEVNRTRVL